MFRYLFVMLMSLIICSAEAKHKKKAIQHQLKPPQTSMVVDCKTGKILHSENAHAHIYPASLTKIMTLYLAFDAIDSGKLSMNKKLFVSKNAELMRPSKLGLKHGEYISTYHAIMGLIVRSANDAAVVLAEQIAGSEENFAKKMNEKAKELGMNNTIFKNASGWHHIHQKTTPVDLAKLAIAIKKHHARFYHLFSYTNFAFKGQKIQGHNRVVANYPWADGLKTGYTSPAGFNLITTASKDNKDLVAIVTGSNSAKIRDTKMITLLDKHLGIEKKQPLKRSVKKNIKIASNMKNKKKVATNSPI